MATITGDDILSRIYAKRALDQSGPLDQEQFGWLDWGQLGRDLPFFRGSAQGGDQRIDPEALAAYLTQNQYSIGQEAGPGNADIRWLQDASGNELIKRRDYATNDRTAAILGMLALGGAGAAAIAGGGAAAGGAAGSGAAAGGSSGLIDAALAAEMASAGTLAPEGVGALYGAGAETAMAGGGAFGGGLLGGTGTTAAASMLEPAIKAPADSLIEKAAAEEAVKAGTLAPEGVGDLFTAGSTAATGSSLLDSPVTVNPPSSVPTSTPSTDTPAPEMDYFDKLKSFMTDPKNADLVKMMFGGAGALMGGSISEPYTGPMPTITQDGWMPQVQAKQSALKTAAPGLLGVPGQAQSGLWRYGLMG